MMVADHRETLSLLKKIQSGAKDEEFKKLATELTPVDIPPRKPGDEVTPGHARRRICALPRLRRTGHRCTGAQLCHLSGKRQRHSDGRRRWSRLRMACRAGAQERSPGQYFSQVPFSGACPTPALLKSHTPCG